MKNNLQILVSAGQKKERLDRYLTNRIENATRTKVQVAIKKKEILVNGKFVKSSYNILPGDLIIINIDKGEPPEVLAENIPLEIFFEDQDLIIVNKPAGMVTHPAYKNYSGTLVNALMHRFNLQKLSVNERPGIVHRLDKDTSGLLVVAKNETALQKLAKQFALKTSKRTYHAIVWGIFKQKKGLIDAPLGRSKSDRKKIVVVEGGKPAITEYEVLEEFGFLSLIKLNLRTGRTHQIRSHLNSIHHPVFGDPAYGGRNSSWNGLAGKKKILVQNLLEICQRQALHATLLGVKHPTTGKELIFSSPLPNDINTILNKLRNLK
ncbi:MAG: RluA family pseudouridine synthase [Bacteroidetes bacterium]|nr:RluA family pseudouridine synthase [Bacteroidota bacterium]